MPSGALGHSGPPNAPLAWPDPKLYAVEHSSCWETSGSASAFLSPGLTIIYLPGCPWAICAFAYASELLGSPFELLAHDTVAHIWAQSKAWHEPRFFQDACRMPRAQTWGQTEIPTQQARPGSHSKLCQLLNHSRLFCAQRFVVRAISLRPQHGASSEWMPLGSFFGQVSCMEILWFKALTAATSGKMLNGRTLENMQLLWSQVSSRKPQENNCEVTRV